MVMNIATVVMDVGQMRSEFRTGRLSGEQLLDIIDQLQQDVQRLEAGNRRLTERLAQYEPEASRQTIFPETSWA
jgi:hypothetical protein